MAQNPQRASGLATCPPDILYLVFKLLSPADYYSLSLVNKGFHIITEPFLYSRIHGTWRVDVEPSSPPRLPQLLRTLLSRPQLATHITTVHLDGYRDDPNKFRWKLSTFCVSDGELDLDDAVAFIHRTKVPCSELWIQEVRSGSIDALVAILLAQLPNLKHLYMARDFTRQSTLLGMVLRLVLCQPERRYNLPGLQHLQDVSYIIPDGEDGTRDRKKKNTADILPFLYLPNLEHLSASIENPAQLSWPAPHKPLAAKLMSLELTHVREHYLAELLSVTPSLRALEWHWYYDNGVKDQFITPIIHIDYLVAALSSVKHTLMDLVITAHCDIGGGDVIFPAVKLEGPLDALVDFTSLRRLQVPWAFLVGFAVDTARRLQDVVPRNLEHLIITDDLQPHNESRRQPDWPQWGWTGQTVLAVLAVLESWLSDTSCASHLPQHITLLFGWADADYNGWDSWAPAMKSRLRELGAQAGVACEIVELDPERFTYL
ncbi:hypothetical protein BDW72DRAFT_212801 [Aspergillus terricola var. indicus]